MKIGFGRRKSEKQKKVEVNNISRLSLLQFMESSHKSDLIKKLCFVFFLSHFIPRVPFASLLINASFLVHGMV
jgi:hypothetical protein